MLTIPALTSATSSGLGSNNYGKVILTTLCRSPVGDRGIHRNGVCCVSLASVFQRCLNIASFAGNFSLWKLHCHSRLVCPETFLSDIFIRKYQDKFADCLANTHENLIQRNTLKYRFRYISCTLYPGVKIGHVGMDQTFVKWNNR